MPSHSSVPAPDAAAVAEPKWLIEALLGRPDCDIFRELEELRRHMRAMGFTPRFRSPPPPSSQLIAQHGEVMYRVLQSMDGGSEHPLGFARRTAWFLDIGSKTSGFVRYILDHTPAARGVGVTHRANDSGLGWAAPPGDRFELHELDLPDLVTRYLQSDPASRTLPFTRTIFDFITIDLTTSSPRILLAQLLLALSTIHDGGQILLTLSCIERPLTARILIAFSRIADYISVSKPPQVRAWGGLFYLHAETIRIGPAYWKFKDNLYRLWNRIHTTDTRDPTWDEEDLITPWIEVMERPNVAQIVKLANPVWGTQLTALRRALGIDVNRID